MAKIGQIGTGGRWRPVWASTSTTVIRRSQPVSRVLSRTVIHLGRVSPRASSSLPEGFRGPRLAVLPALPPYLALLRMGFSLPSLLPVTRCALTAPFHPYLCLSRGRRPSAVHSLWHFPWVCTPQALPGITPCGARTFLHGLRHSDCSADSVADFSTPSPGSLAQTRTPCLE